MKNTLVTLSIWSLPIYLDFYSLIYLDSKKKWQTIFNKKGSSDSLFYYGSYLKVWDWDCALLVPSKTIALTWPIEKIAVFDTKFINCDVTAGHKYVHFSSSGIAPGGCFPRARPPPPCPGKGYVDVVRKERF